MRFDGISSESPLFATGADFVCTHDLEGHILSANAAACEALGMTMAELRKVSIRDLLPPDAGCAFDDYMKILLRDGAAAGMMNVETTCGRRIWEYRNTIERNEDAAPVVRGVARDVTEREAEFQDVRRSEDYFRPIIENASDIIAIIGRDGQFRYGSPSVERVLGYSRKALAAIAGIDLIHPDDAATASAFLKLQIATPAAVQTVELRARHQDGTWRSFEVVATNLVEKGHTSAVVINARDITERKLLEAQLEQANRLGGLGRLAATVAHEFNNVLMGMQPFAELMQREDVTPQIISKGAWHIANSIQRGRRIVLDILRFSQPHVPVTDAVDLGEWWESFSAEAEAVLGNMIAVQSSIPKRGLYVVADRSQLGQVIANLVANARDAMPCGGVLTVSANPLQPNARFAFGVIPHPERFVQITVRDTGCGIPPEVKDRIFEPLFTTRQSGGTGLGLAVAHQVLTQHGGYIFVESEEGRGSAFHIFLPKASSPQKGNDSDTASPRMPAAKKLLIIDDETAISDGIAALLEQDGITVEAITTGLEAAQAIKAFRPDVVLLDFGLPDLDGSEVYALIRKVDANLGVIFATGHGDRRILHDRLHDPRTRFLQKPFEVADLLAMMVDLEEVTQ
ncbi:MAG: PAS domain S-box protein [Acidobacteria bacterium]|nr:PAS domain S-box protein [Acidobacteriota bacterium]MBV9070141.1 PAS domain S-box protein [Acidobacteriota bacterium]MBV9186316.1 PAS domain S-box protein [Acidobacteriota bacterium]